MTATRKNYTWIDTKNMTPGDHFVFQRVNTLFLRIKMNLGGHGSNQEQMAFHMFAINPEDIPLDWIYLYQIEQSTRDFFLSQEARGKDGYLPEYLFENGDELPFSGFLDTVKEYPWGDFRDNLLLVV